MTCNSVTKAHTLTVIIPADLSPIDNHLILALKQTVAATNLKTIERWKQMWHGGW